MYTVHVLIYFMCYHKCIGLNLPIIYVVYHSDININKENLVTCFIFN